ncbi:iron-sulfur cluster repair protein YtfE [Cupriavidus sp. WKF15]|uniref:iron-sulfur cluster repair protein YtfE n=1 Tax=Cupriavidus sp. WKF15 TaxID=3032282 RepID=UPI0023E20261|nr:iron-sulfur cluster repair protein YtfE [Cupriavidus sp. WKF15]WER49314.1 iron-sulfur cluster repair protein YtfE [Cupriavidus sp. WKF15]
MRLQDQPLGQLARRIPGATGIFHDYDLDFCCGGKQTLRDAAAAKGLDAEAIETRLQTLQRDSEPVQTDWDAVPPASLIAHILTRFHERHREQLPELIRLARRVEHVHGDRPDCPVGLADHLVVMRDELEAHMQKEEQVLFPMLARGLQAAATAPITVMRMEHDDHGEALQRLATLTNDITLPRAACNTWRALYLGLRTLREDLMEHIHLENNILFEPATAQAAND